VPGVDQTLPMRMTRIATTLIIVLLFAGSGLPSASPAQRPKGPTIGVLVVGSPGSERFWRLFRGALRELGYIEGQNVRFEFRSDQGQASHLPALAAALVGLKVDIIVTWFTPAARAAKMATRDIPIVMALTGNPVETGLVDSLARPGGNITGIASVGGELAGKCVELIREMMPSARRIAVLANAPDPFSKPFVDQIRLAGSATRMTIDPIMLHSSEDLEAAFPAMRKQPPDAVMVQASLPTKRVAELALRYRLPTVAVVRGLVDEGGLMSYGIDEADAYGRAAALVDKILKGAKPADIPIEQPTKFELVINLKTAKLLGLTIPSSLLLRADQVLE
jgi:putative tryptophan/tyrosine transport system substrate-binding protein